MEGLREQLLTLFATPVYIIAIGLELILSNFHFHQKVYTFKDTLANTYLNLVNFGVDFLFRVVYLGALVWLFNANIFFHWQHYGTAYWLLLLLAEDFAFYWMHRFDHEIRFFWAVHVTHHSSMEFNFTTGFRSSVLEPLYRFVYFIPLVWLGFRPLDIIFMYALTQIWGTFVHTKLIDKMGWLEYIFVTPSHHRVHHASNPKYLDKNMGMFLIIWDKMFGTFQKELSAEAYEPIRYGLTKNLEKPNAKTIIFHEWIQIYKDITGKNLSMKEKWNYLFGPPGYSHDGSRKTSRQMRAAEAKEQKKL
jgi:sterol desaturase/sphingolipid hydroxylase (fatty acid hydroxylase superfamily)